MDESVQPRLKRDAPKDSYHSLGLPMGWMSLCNPDYSRYSLTERKGWLRLRPSTTDLSETASPTFVARRQTELNFTATALFDLSHLSEGMQAGITAYAAPLNHYDVVAEKRNGQIIIKSNVPATAKRSSRSVAPEPTCASLPTKNSTTCRHLLTERTSSSWPRWNTVSSALRLSAVSPE